SWRAGLRRRRLLPSPPLFRSPGLIGAGARPGVLLGDGALGGGGLLRGQELLAVQPGIRAVEREQLRVGAPLHDAAALVDQDLVGDRKSTRLNSSHVKISYAVF